MTDYLFRRTCPASPSCTWRGRVVRGLLEDDVKPLDDHLSAVHPDAVGDLWDAWEPVGRDPDSYLHALVVMCALVCVGLLGLHAGGLI